MELSDKGGKLAEIPNQNENMPPVSFDDSKISNTLETFGLINKKSDENYSIPEDAQRLALYKIDLINLWQEYRNKTVSKVAADKKFVKLFNDKKYNKFLYEKIGKISIRTLSRWYKTYIEADKEWRALINNYSYGCESQLITNLKDIEKYYLLKYMLHQNQFNFV